MSRALARSLVATILFTLPAHAGEVLVLGQRPAADSSIGTRSLLRQNELETATTVADSLRQLPGVEVVRQGTIGQPTAIFIRGARSEDTLVFIDGVEMNDAGSTSGAFDFAAVSPDRVKSIEILRGPQSVRYGPGALGGVINIVTEDGSTPKTKYNLEGGSYRTWRAGVTDAGRSNAFRYSINADHFLTAGFSAAAAADGNTEPDGAEVDTLSAKLGWDAAVNTSAELTSRLSLSKTDFDRHGGPGGDDPNATSSSKQYSFGLTLRNQTSEKTLRSVFAASHAKNLNESRNPPDAVDVTDTENHFDSATDRARLDADLSVSEFNSLKFRTQWRRDLATTDAVPNKTTSTLGQSITYGYDDGVWFGDLGSRLDYQLETAGSVDQPFVPSFRTAIGRRLFDETLRTFLTYGTGFKLPSLYQLYSTYGDPNLREERGRALEWSVEKTFTRLQIDVSFFRNRYDNLIDFDPARGKYFNAGNAAADGIESRITFNLEAGLKIDATYTYLDAINTDTGQPLLRRPTNSWSISARQPLGSFEIGTDFRYRGDRADIDPITFSRTTNSAYGIWNASASYRFRTNRLWLRAENLLNTDYREVAGYGTAGLSAALGLTGEL